MPSDKMPEKDGPKNGTQRNRATMPECFLLKRSARFNGAAEPTPDAAQQRPESPSTL